MRSASDTGSVRLNWLSANAFSFFTLGSLRRCWTPTLALVIFMCATMSASAQDPPVEQATGILSGNNRTLQLTGYYPSSWYYQYPGGPPYFIQIGEMVFDLNGQPTVNTPINIATGLYAPYIADVPQNLYNRGYTLQGALFAVHIDGSSGQISNEQGLLDQCEQLYTPNNLMPSFAATFATPGIQTISMTVYFCNDSGVETTDIAGQATWYFNVPPPTTDPGPCAAECEGVAGQPVNLTTGDVWISKTDYSVPGLGGVADVHRRAIHDYFCRRGHQEIQQFRVFDDCNGPQRKPDPGLV